MAFITRALARSSMPPTWPRRLLRSPMTSPMNSSGTTTSTFMIGSRPPPPVPDPGAPRQRLELDDRVAVLALAAGLADVPALALGGAGDGLAVRDLGLSDVGGHPGLPPHAVDDHLAG